MEPETPRNEAPRQAGQPQSAAPSHIEPRAGYRMGLAMISLAFMVALVNIVAYLSASFGQMGSAIVFAAVCLTIIGVNVAFNFDLLRRRL